MTQMTQMGATKKTRLRQKRVPWSGSAKYFAGTDDDRSIPDRMQEQIQRIQMGGGSTGRMMATFFYLFDFSRFFPKS
jgi:hypothetical protein